ncbi:MAG TPA: OsmC family peroxiredoxin [Actinomycetota bacterium]|nr:OsmC family peroxiredoxin [Actinomycetota bacterium]
MAVDKHATVTWHGDLTTGRGTIDDVGSGAISALPVTWAARTGDQAELTSPEELLAAAHASCFSMSFSSRLGKNETPPDRLRVSSTVTFVPGTGVTTSKLVVDADVPGIDEETFRALAEDAREKCPVSQALANNVEITLDATLSSG